VGYLVKNTSIVDGQYNPTFVNVLNMTNTNVGSAEFNYQIFNNSLNIAGWIRIEFDTFTTVGRFRFNLPNFKIGTIQARCKGTYSNIDLVSTLTRVNLNESTTDLNNPVEFLVNTSVAGSVNNISFNLIYTFS
jgi:hypothetical protein